MARKKALTAPKPAHTGTEIVPRSLKAVTIEGSNNLALNPDCLPQLVEAAGTQFAGALSLQIADATSLARNVREDEVNFCLAVVEGIQPQDHLEAMLASQMAVVHQQAMASVRKLGNSQNIPQQDTNEKTLNKLMRTFAMQMDTLKRYRSRGEQRVYVERVNVESGAQAVIGDVHTADKGGRGL